MLEAVGDSVIVKLQLDEKVGSIIIPDNVQAKDSGFHGTTVSVGEDVTLDIKVGDRLCFFRSEGFKIEHDEVEYLSVSQKHILGVFN